MTRAPSSDGDLRHGTQSVRNQTVSKGKRRFMPRFMHRVRIRGEWACFTRAELKTERVTYHVVTPSAARGAVEAILWKPAIRWHVHRIAVLAPIKFAAVKRNE